MKDLGVIAWALFLSYLFMHDYFWWIWGTVIVVGVTLGIRKGIQQNRERKELERELEEIDRKIAELERGY